MAGRRRWGDLSRSTQRLIMIGAGFEGTLKIAALVDLKRRPATQIRGPKWAWAVAVAVANSVGAVPLAYFFLGRRRTVT
jgi:hypothetical protein